MFELTKIICIIQCLCRHVGLPRRKESTPRRRWYYRSECQTWTFNRDALLANFTLVRR